MEPVMETPGRPKKRRKVQEACTACRRRKTRCDGRKPVCIACEDRGVGGACEYLPIASATSLLHRLDVSTVTKAHRQRSSLSHLSAKSTSRVEALPDASTSIHPAATETTTAILSVPSYTQSDELYGPASNVSFSRSIVPQIRRSAPKNGNEPQQGNLASLHNCRESLGEVPAILPLRKTADDLVRAYFDLIWPLFPVLHRASFMKRYELLWAADCIGTQNDNSAEDAMYLSVLNLVFALGSQCSTQIALEKRCSLADEFYKRSQSPCLVIYLDNPSLLTVQLHLLCAIYLQSVDAGRCWYFTGTAIRLAQALGLHAESRFSTQSTRTQLKVRRCVWHTCVTFDRLTAMGFGRPTMIQPGTGVPLPIAIDGLIKVGSSDYIAGETDDLMLFVYSCKLFDILHDVLQQFYPSDGVSFAADNHGTLVTQTLEVVRRLDRLESIIPTYLLPDCSRKVDSTGKFSVLHLQQQVLFCRFQFVRILALRRLLLESVRLESSLPTAKGSPRLNSPLDAAVIRQSYKDCVDASCQLVEALYNNLDTPYRNSPWHTVYLVFSAATVLLAACQSKSIDTQTRESQFSQIWEQCFAILSYHAPHLSSAAKAYHTLHAMRENLFSGPPKETMMGQVSKQHRTTSEATKYPTNDVTTFTGPPSVGSTDEIGDMAFQMISDDWLDQFIADMSWLEVPPPSEF